MPGSSRFFTFALLLAASLFGVLGTACGHDVVPPLVEVTEISPREIELGDRIEVKGAGFPQGRTARLTFHGTMFRPGQSPTTGATVEIDGLVTASDRIELLVADTLEERFCGHGDYAIHTTMTGDLEVAFSSSTPGAPPLVGMMRGMTLDITPSGVRASVVESRIDEGKRVLAFFGVTPGAASPLGLPIEKLENGSPGERAGFQVGDLIAAVDGVHVRELSDVAPASARSALVALRHNDSGTDDVKTVPMIGYAGDRIPTEYGPALLLVGLALAVLVLLVLPAPAVAAALELRVARRLRGVSARSLLRGIFGRGPTAIFSVLASILVGTFALGPFVIAPDLDLGLLLVVAIALLLGSRVAVARGFAASLRSALDVGVVGMFLAAATAGVVISGGAFRLAEIVRAQGGAPWEASAIRQPALLVLAALYCGALLVLVRAREELPLLAHARREETPAPATPTRHSNGRLLERLGLLFASALGVALFFGGWALPGGIEARSTPLQALAALLFMGKTWLLCAALLGASAIASPWTSADARQFVLRRLLPALLLGALLVAATRRMPPSESLEAACGATLATASILLLLRVGLRIRDAARRPEPHASPFL